MTITKRVILLLAVPLAALVGLGVFTRLQLAKVEDRSRFVAESRIQALATLGNLSRSFGELRVQVRSHLLATNGLARTAARSAFDTNEQAVTRLLAQYADKLLVSDQGRRLHNEYRTLSREWVTGARQVMALSDAARREDAAALLSGSTADIGQRVSQVGVEWTRNIEELATNAGQEALKAISTSRWKILAGNGTAILLTALLGFVTFRGIVRPIHALEASVKAIAAGDYALEVPFINAANETGGLARSVDVLKRGAAAMDDQRWVKSIISNLAGELQDADSLALFGQRLLSGLVPALGGGVAGLYLQEEKSDCVRRIAAYGLVEGAELQNSFRRGEGMVGQCALERKRVVLDRLPPDYLQIVSGLGAAPAARALALPLMSGEALLGVLELGTFREFNSREAGLLQELLPVAALSLEVLQRNLRTKELLDQTQEQARQLEEQTAELTQSQEELLAQKEELLTQQRELTTQREQLKVSEERSRLILESSAEGIFGVDTEGRITFVNPAACSLLGFEPEELIQQPSHAAIHHHHPDGRLYPKEECPMFAAYKAGTASRIDDEFLWRKDGTGLAVEYGATPMLKDGVVVGAVVSFTDITLRKQQEAELQTQHSALESAANAIAIIDRSGTIEWVNPAFTKLTGYTREEAVGQNPRVLKSGLHQPEFYANMWRTVLAGSVWQGTLTNKRKDGALYQEEMTITPVRTKRGEVTHFVAVKQDITERIRAETELRQRTNDLQHTNFLADSALDLTKAGYWHVPLDGSGWYNSSHGRRVFLAIRPAPTTATRWNTGLNTCG